MQCRQFMGEASNRPGTSFNSSFNRYQKKPSFNRYQKSCNTRRGNGNSSKGRRFDSNYIDGKQETDDELEEDICFQADCDREISHKQTGNVDNIVFLIDSGCTDHLVNNKECFDGLIMLKNPIKIEILYRL